MREYNSTDYSIIQNAVKAAYAFGLGCISNTKRELRDNDIMPPKNIDSLVFKATEELEKQLN